MQITTRPLHHALSGIEVFATDRDGPAIVVLDRSSGVHVEVDGREREWPFRWTAYRFPTGEQLEDRCVPTVWPHEAEIEVAQIPRRALGRFDFDGDGVEDLLLEGKEPTYAGGGPALGEDGEVRVVSGRDSSVLFAEPLGPGPWWFEKRATPLGDVDGDGCSEFALRPPRAIDAGPWALVLERALGSQSAISIVSGSRIPR